MSAIERMGMLCDFLLLLSRALLLQLVGPVGFALLLDTFGLGLIPTLVSNLSAIGLSCTGVGGLGSASIVSPRSSSEFLSRLRLFDLRPDTVRFFLLELAPLFSSTLLLLHILLLRLLFIAFLDFL